MTETVVDTERIVAAQLTDQRGQPSGQPSGRRS
jgi:hypothetical protein